MTVKLHEEIEALLKDNPDSEQLVNNIVMVYLKGGFVRESEAINRFTLDKVFRRQSNEIAEAFDEITHEFKGVVVVGKSKSESLWIPDIDLHDLIEQNDEIIVLKSPRKSGISVVESEDRYSRGFFKKENLS